MSQEVPKKAGGRAGGGGVSVQQVSGHMSLSRNEFLQDLENLFSLVIKPTFVSGSADSLVTGLCVCSEQV